MWATWAGGTVDSDESPRDETKFTMLAPPFLFQADCGWPGPRPAPNASHCQSSVIAGCASPRSLSLYSGPRKRQRQPFSQNFHLLSATRCGTTTQRQQTAQTAQWARGRAPRGTKVASECMEPMCRLSAVSQPCSSSLCCPTGSCFLQQLVRGQ